MYTIHMKGTLWGALFRILPVKGYKTTPAICATMGRFVHNFVSQRLQNYKTAPAICATAKGNNRLQGEGRRVRRNVMR